GETTDDILRVFGVSGDQRTPDASHLASLFPAINRNPVAVDAGLAYYRVPDVRLGFPADAVNARHLLVSNNGRYFITTDGSGCGPLGFQRRDGASGLPRGPFATFGQCGVTDGVTGLVGLLSFNGSDVGYAAASSANAVVPFKMLDGNEFSLSVQTFPA